MNVIFSGGPPIYSTESGLIDLITSWTIFSGVDAPEVIPTVFTFFNQSKLISSGPSIKYEGTPLRIATSFNLWQFELLFAPITKTRSHWSANNSVASCLLVVA